MNMPIHLPTSLNDYVQSQVAAGRYASADEFVSALVQADQEEQRMQALMASDPRIERLLEESLDSGPGRIWNADVLNEHKQRVLDRAGVSRDQT